MGEDSAIYVPGKDDEGCRLKVLVTPYRQGDNLRCERAGDAAGEAAGAVYTSITWLRLAPSC